MKQIYTTYFWMSEGEVRQVFSDTGMADAVAVSSSAEYLVSPAGKEEKFVSVLKQKASFLVARRPGNIVYVTDAGFLRRFILALLRPRTPLGPSLQHSKNAVMIMIPSIEANARRLIPGLVCSYFDKSEMYTKLVNEIILRTTRREGMLISKSAEGLLDDGYIIWVG